MYAVNKDMFQGQDTTHFSYDYITVNSMAYVALFVAIRNGTDFTHASNQLKGVVFHTFHRPVCQWIVPRHFAFHLKYFTTYRKQPFQFV